MKPSLLLALAMLSFIPSVAYSQPGCVRLSWGGCDPWVENMSFNAPGPYTLVESMYGVSMPNQGTYCKVRIRQGTYPGVLVPDAWRFDDSGCQSGTRLLLHKNPASLACPAMKGTNILTLTEYGIDVDGSAWLILAETYNLLTPSANTRYTIWQVTFDHSFSSSGQASYPMCGGAELCENFSFDFAMLLAEGPAVTVPSCDEDLLEGVPAGTLATWNGGCPVAIATEPVTWGKLRGLYH